MWSNTSWLLRLIPNPLAALQTLSQIAPCQALIFLFLFLAWMDGEIFLLLFLGVITFIIIIYLEMLSAACAWTTARLVAAASALTHSSLLLGLIFHLLQFQKQK